ncbi:MAG: pyruvate ferredoxin oxidoreductase [Firmicutes bacterium]|nr:pyruvate ferredoxin oxidoreductase [Bacillota bacterium]
MGKKALLTGVVAVAHAVKMADVDVIASYPIRPYTGVMSELARMIADGELDAEMIRAEGEHSQLSIAYGASAAGARTFVGSSGVGVTYAYEVYSPISGARLPVQMMIADRTLDPPGDFGSEHTDALCCRDQGWLMGWAETPQEALDMCLVYYRAGEDPQVSLPQYACQDGYFVSHITGEVAIPDPAQVREFLPPFRPVRVLDPAKPIAVGPQIEPSMGPPLQYQRYLAMQESRRVLTEAYEEFAGIFGRRYAPLVEAFLADDAEVLLVTSGAHTATARNVVQKLRGLGEKIGLLKLRSIRPFPDRELAAACDGAKVVGVLDNDAAFGISGGGGVLYTEVCTALQGGGLGDRELLGFVAGLGGEVISREEFYWMAQVMLDRARRGPVAASGKRESGGDAGLMARENWKKTFWLPFDMEAGEGAA